MDNANKKVNAALYIVLALIVVAVVCMTVFSVVSGSKKPNDSPIPNTPEGSQTTNRNESNNTPDNTNTPESTSPPKETEDVIVDEDTDSEDVDAPVKLTYTNPVEGYLLKGFDIDMPVYSITMNDYRVHSGIDILSEIGAPVMSIAEGTVQNIYNDPMMGNCISVNHGNGLVSYYMGLSDEVCQGVEEGAPVFCGQTLSSIGDSTLIEIAEEPHLHLELKLNDKHIDPMEYLVYENTSSEGAIDESYEG